MHSTVSCCVCPTLDRSMAIASYVDGYLIIARMIDSEK